MAYQNVLSDIPKIIAAGESVSWKKSFADFPASSWTLTYSLVKSDYRIQITSVADGSAHLIEIPLSTTAGWTPGKYQYQAYASNGTERYLVDSGKIEILTDFAGQADGFDARSWIDTVIDALEASIHGRASKTQVSQSVGGVQIQHMTLAEQTAALTEFKKQRAGKAFRKNGFVNMGVRFP